MYSCSEEDAVSTAAMLAVAVSQAEQEPQAVVCDTESCAALPLSEARAWALPRQSPKSSVISQDV